MIIQEVDRKLRKEQEGYRGEKNSTDHVFVLQNIIEQPEQCMEWNSTLFVNFVDFRKALIALIAKAYGIQIGILRKILTCEAVL